MSTRSHPEGVLLINFGEPESPDADEVVPFLERIFLANSDLENPESVEAAKSRSRELARRRAPGLVADYERIGGSPLNRQAVAQARALTSELERRGRPGPVVCGMQFTRPSIADGLAELRAAGAGVVSVLPVYPICGPSTTVASLREVRRELESTGWSVDAREITGWHRHPAYVRLRARAIRLAAEQASLDLESEDVEVVFSAHGTPLEYVRSGSRYVEYVEDSCMRVAAELGISRYTLGYQNHSHRGIEWTRPSIDEAVTSLASSRRDVLVDPVSFVHEQSETLGELDLELREVAESAGLGFYRVPVPHDSPDLIGVFADVVEASRDRRPAELPPHTPCSCRPGATVCLNDPVP